MWVCVCEREREREREEERLRVCVRERGLESCARSRFALRLCARNRLFPLLTPRQRERERDRRID